MGTKTHFEKQAKGNSKTAYFYCTNKKYEHWFDFGMLGRTNEMVYYFTDGIVITAELPLFYSSPSWLVNPLQDTNHILQVNQNPSGLLFQLTFYP